MDMQLMQFKKIYLPQRNPSLSQMEWPDAWRSHSVNAHKVPAATADVLSSAYCSRVYEPMLDGAGCDLLGLSQEYDGIGIANYASNTAFARVDPDITPEDLFAVTGLRLEDREMLEADELRVFAAPVPSCTLRCEETVAYGTDFSRPAGALIAHFLVRKARALGDFQDKLDKRHHSIGERAMNGTGTVTRYVHNRVTKRPPVRFQYDSVIEMWFADVEDAVRFLRDDSFGMIADDITQFYDIDRSTVMLTHVTNKFVRKPSGNEAVATVGDGR